MSYYQQSWAARSGALGDEAEAKFAEVWPATVEPYGLNRAQVNLANVPATVRYTPDFLVNDRLVECMGIGRDGTLKLKMEKLAALHVWDHFFNTWLFIWNSADKRWTIQPIKEVSKRCESVGVVSQFPEGKAAWFLPVNQVFTWDWTDDAAA